jgi:hypothetical protein
VSIETMEKTIHEFHLDEVAAKRYIKKIEHDMKDMGTRLQRQIELIRADTARQIAESKADL